MTGSPGGRRPRSAAARAPLYALGRSAPARRLAAFAALAALAGSAAALAPGPIPASTPTAADSATPLDTPSGDPPVAVASSLRAAWPALERAWRERLPDVGARPTFGASRTLARQIERGAPFELFLSADETSVELLSATRVVPGTRARYARGRLALVTRGPPPAADADPLVALAERLEREPRTRLAIANPGHAPYGQAAREALERVGAWPLAPARLVTGENAAQTLQFLLAGAVDAALVPSALVAGGAPPGLHAEPIAPTAHAPLVHALVAVDGASDAAVALGAWFASDAARDALAAAGFDAPP